MANRNDVTRDQVEQRIREHRNGQPPLGRALRSDAAAFAVNRGESATFHSTRAEWANVLRMCWRSGDFVGLALYRVRVALSRAGVPIFPTLLNKILVWFFGIRIGEHVLIEPGVYVNHGNVIIDGVTRIRTGSVVTAWVTIGLQQGNFLGPDVGPAAFIGLKASVLGDIRVGRGAQVGAHSVVVDHVPDNAIVAGVPARIVAEGVPGPLERGLAARTHTPEPPPAAEAS